MILNLTGALLAEIYSRTIMSLEHLWRVGGEEMEKKWVEIPLTFWIEAPPFKSASYIIKIKHADSNHPTVILCTAQFWPALEQAGCLSCIVAWRLLEDNSE